MNDAFEELCSLLAAHVPEREKRLQTGWQFDRIGRPDAGKECIWCSPAGGQEIWQAKWFQSGLGTTQWKQIDKSVRRAIAEHPNVTRITVCTNHDRPDPKGIDNRTHRRRQTALDRWQSFVTQWRALLGGPGSTVEFVYWGTSEILDQLNDQKHVGRRRYFFDRELFTPEWFARHVAEQAANAGPRYSPEVHVALPDLASVFSFLALTNQSRDVVLDALEEIRSAHHSLQQDLELANMPVSVLEAYKKAYALIDKEAHNAVRTPGGPSVQDTDTVLDHVRAANSSPELKRIVVGSETESLRAVEKQLHISFLGFNKAFRKFFEIIRGEKGICLTTRSLLLTGQGGSGKTHLLCDVAQRHAAANLPSLLYLGQQHEAKGPWEQMYQRTGLSFASRDEFLGALDAAGEVAGCRALILFDALNEVADDPAKWKHELPGMLATLKQYHSIAIAFGVRDSYVEYVVPETLSDDKLPRLHHEGFASHVFEAVDAYFDYYNIRVPDAPMLEPEFNNPLFLKVFCEAVAGKPDPQKRRRPVPVPTGAQGLSAVFDAFVATVNQRLTDDLKLDIDLYSKPVEHAVRKIAEAMAATNRMYLPKAAAAAIVKKIMTGGTGVGRQLERLVSEGVLARDVHYQSVGHERVAEEVIRFNYDRFAAHLVIRLLLQQHFDPATPSAAFETTNPLGALVSDASTWLRNANLGEALLLQLPELHGHELFDLVPGALNLPRAREMFVGGLMWRPRETVTERTKEVLRSCFDRYTGHLVDIWLDLLVAVSVRASHPLNADYLHALLGPKSLPERDALWTIRLPYIGREGSAVDRLIRWASQQSESIAQQTEALRLASVTLAWCCSATVRRLRDRATKALVALLQYDLLAAGGLIQLFRDVNDPYVLDRVVTAAYGAAMRSADDAALRSLTWATFECIFGDGSPPLQVIARDSARGIIELAVRRGLVPELNVSAVRPPYRSTWVVPVPNWQELEGRYESLKPSQSFRRLLNSCRGYHGFGDFGIYTIGRYWRGWTMRHGTAASASPGARSGNVFEPDLPHRYVFQRALELGWSPERFDAFDSRHWGEGRERPPVERIGKKYQWIAFGEFRARLSDNLDHAELHEGESETAGATTWPLSAREVDPSMLLKATRDEHTNLVEQKLAWWAPVSLSTERRPVGDVTWLGRSQGLPDVEPLLLVTNPETNIRWAVLSQFLRWRTPGTSKTGAGGRVEREAHYIIDSYLTRAVDADAFVDWAEEEELYNDPLPRAPSFIHIYWGELWWAPSTLPLLSESKGTWIVGSLESQPCPVITTCRTYLLESDETTIDSSVSLVVPDAWLSESLGLRTSRREGEFVDAAGQVIAYDPSAREAGPSCLLVREDALGNLLRRRKLSLVWTILGEKNLYRYTNNSLDSGFFPGRLVVRGAYVLDHGARGNTKYRLSKRSDPE